MQGFFYGGRKMIHTVKTRSKTELIDITADVRHSVRSSGIVDGLCMLYVPHTTAAVTINESADPSVRSDILMMLNKIVPRNAEYRHLEGNSDAHIKSTLVGASELIPVKDRQLVLGTWQAIFFCEFDGPRNRQIHMTIITG
jgi:secondary thiamine-phosphate synthase enzyme